MATHVPYNEFDPSEFSCIDEYDYDQYSINHLIQISREDVDDLGLDIQEMRLDDSRHETEDTMEDVPF